MSSIAYFMIFLFLANNAYAATDMNAYASKYLADIENGNTPVFFSGCESKTIKYRATLVFEIGKSKGLLIEKMDKFVINLATVIIGDKGLIIEETHGGTYTYERVKKLANEIAKYRFYLLLPFTKQILENKELEESCLNTP